MARLLKAPPELDLELAEVETLVSDDPANDNAERWRRGDLAFKLLPHQHKAYDAFHEWDQHRRTAEYAAHVERVAARYDDVFMYYGSRRVGKTSTTILLLDEKAIALPLTGVVEYATLMYFTAFQKDITDIIVPLQDELARDCPREIKPEFHRSRMAQGMGLYFPNGSYIKLVGVDKHPDGLRGRFNDTMAGSEVAFMKMTLDGRGLSYIIKSVLLPQLVRRPWASLILETSAPEDPEHCVVTEFRPDCEARSALCVQTLDDNTSIDEREYAKIIRQSGGRGDPNCEREYFNVVSRDPSQYVVPEWNDEKNVREIERPANALCYVIADPGAADMFGLTFNFVDFERALYVTERGWARKNASTRQVAAVIAYYEWKLWGRQPSEAMRDIPVRRARERDGWTELLVGTDATAEDAEQLYELANLEADARAPLEWPLQAPEGLSTYWHRNERCSQQNPYARYSDVDLRFVIDLGTDFRLNFSPTAKDDADAQRNAFRNAVESGRYICDPRAPQVIAHIKNAIWPETGAREGTKWARHPTYGHFDLLACGIYGWRNADFTLNPNVPQHLIAEHQGQFVDPAWKRLQESEQDEVASGLLGGGRAGSLRHHRSERRWRR